MPSDTVMCAIESKDIPLCPNCKKDLPIPAIQGIAYKCPFCKSTYTLDAEFIRVFRTQLQYDTN